MSTNGSLPGVSSTPLIATPAAAPHRLTEGVIRELRKPFEPELVKWKVQTNPREDSDMAVVVAYIDARDVAERLDIATDGDWSDDYAKPVVLAGGQHSLECRLTVYGVTRRDVGTVPAPREGDDDTKNLYSDAFKRAAVKFGVAAHIYRFPNVMARVEKRGRSCFLTRDAERELYTLAQLVVAGAPRKDWPRFPSLKVWGSVFGADGRLDLFDEQPEASFTPPPETVPPVAPAPALADEVLPTKSPRRAERRSSVATPGPVTTLPATAPAPAALPSATRAESPATALVARVQVAREALATAEAKLGVRPAAPAADAAPTPTRAGQIIASGTQAEQVVRAVAAIKAAYGKAGVAGVDDIGGSTGLFDLVTMTKQDVLGQKVTKTEADEVLRRLAELQECLDTRQESGSAPAETGGYDLSAL